MIDLKDYDTEDLQMALEDLRAAHHPIVPGLLQDLTFQIESRLDDIGQRDWERMGTDE